jgi:ribosomal protein S11
MKELSTHKTIKQDKIKKEILVEQNAPVYQYCCVVRFSMKKNNIFVNLTNLKGQTILKFTAGLIQKRKTKKELRSIVKFIIDKISFFIKANFDCVKIFIKSDGSAKKAMSLFKYFRRKKLKIVYFNAQLPIVHNGCRAPKKRRI